MGNKVGYFFLSNSSQRRKERKESGKEEEKKKVVRSGKSVNIFYHPVCIYTFSWVASSTH